jgi:opacity protein-like surface antigen
MKNLGRFLVVFVLLCVPAFAADNDFTIFGGVQFPGKITLNQATSSIPNIISDPINVGVFGIRYGRAGVFGHEETFAYTPNFLSSTSKSIILNSNFLVQVPAPVFKPYVTAGMGSVLSWGSGPSDIGSKFAINYGGGVKIRPAGPVGIRFDARGYSVFSVQQQTLKMGEVTVGILFSF